MSNCEIVIKSPEESIVRIQKWQQMYVYLFVYAHTEFVCWLIGAITRLPIYGINREKDEKKNHLFLS